MSTPRVSVILPTHDRAGTLGAALESVLGGDFTDLEVLVVDDASRDRTPEVLADFADRRVHCVRIDEQIGAPAARNAGIARARGDVVAFQDSDDVWTPDHLSVLVSALDDSGAGVAYGRARWPSGATYPSAAEPEVEGDLSKALCRYNFIDLPAAAVRRDVIDVVGGFDPALPRLQDWDLFLSIASVRRFAFVDTVVVHVGTADRRISDDRAAYFDALDSILRRHHMLFRADPQVLVGHHLQMAREFWRVSARRRALQQLGHAARFPAGCTAWLRARLVDGRSPLQRALGDEPGER